MPKDTSREEGRRFRRVFDRTPGSNRGRRRGSALFSGIIFAFTLSLLILAYLETAVESSRLTSRGADDLSASTGAESAISLAVDEVWGTFAKQREGLTTKPWDFHNYLDGLGIPDQANVANPVPTDLLPIVGFATDQHGRTVLADAAIESLTVVRRDEHQLTRLFVHTTASTRHGEVGADYRGNASRTVEQVFTVGPAEWNGLDYAMLANNINCLLCHTEVDDAKRFYNSNPNKYGTFERVRLGSIESFQLRADPHSWVAGTLYMTGLGLDEHGMPLEDWSGLNFKSREFDSEGFLLEDVWGDMTASDMVLADLSAPAPFENLYMSYVGVDAQVDGFMPESFPSPFPDDGGYDLSTGQPTPENAGNRVVDKTEFDATVAFSLGSVSGGDIYVLPQGETIDTPGELAQFQTGSNASSLDPITEGTVHLHGTESDPILLNSDVAIDGDLVIHGFVKGTGSLMVRGNVYIPTDLQYADGTKPDSSRAFGQAADGAQNTLAIASGGNVMVGNIFHPAWGEGPPANGEESGSFNFIMDELALFNRMEWMKTQPTLPGKKKWEFLGTEIVQVETYDQELVIWEEEVPVYEDQPTGEYEEVPIYEQQIVGYEDVPIIEQQIVGWESVEIMETIEHPADPPEPYGQPWTEEVGTGVFEDVPIYDDVIVGWESVPIWDDVQIGTEMVPIMAPVQVGVDIVVHEEWQNVGEPYFVDVEKEIWDWVTPQHENPYYQGVGFVPRYYNFTEDSSVIIFNKKGYFDPEAGVWMAAERVEDWSESKLTVADPTDTSNPLLYDSNGDPTAVLYHLTGSTGWIADDLLHDMIQEWLVQRDPADPLAIDGTIYSNNSIFGIIPGRNAPGLDGKLVINGALVAADIGLLAPERCQIFYDERGKEMITIFADDKLSIKRDLVMPSRQP